MTSTAASERLSARERLLAAANELFYAEGVHTVGIDRVIEKAGVAKASLYNTFGSKEELVRAYLQERSKARQERIDAKLSGIDDPIQRLLAVFDAQAELFQNPDFKGCAFMNASAEGPRNESITQQCDAYRAWMRNLFETLAAEAGASDAKSLAEQLNMLYDGANVSRQMDQNRKAAATARRMAESLIEAATRAGTSS
jgi:AcrR family transcriptional regulator